MKYFLFFVQHPVTYVTEYIDSYQNLREMHKMTRFWALRWMKLHRNNM